MIFPVYETINAYYNEFIIVCFWFETYTKFVYNNGRHKYIIIIFKFIRKMRDRPLSPRRLSYQSHNLANMHVLNFSLKSLFFFLKLYYVIVNPNTRVTVY